MDLTKLKLQKKRGKIRRKLRDYGIIPELGSVLNEEQETILNQISNNDFSFYESIKFEKHKKTKTYKKRIHKEEVLPILKKSRLLYELRLCGILPKIGYPTSIEQDKIIDYVNENYETPIKSLITKYNYLTTPEYSLWYRVKNAVSRNKKRRHSEVFFNLDVDDIIIPKFCPYLGVELSIDIKDCHSPNYYTLDRIDSNNGYVKGNVQVISRFTNTMKNNTTIDELLLFSENVIKIHKK